MNTVLQNYFHLSSDYLNGCLNKILESINFIISVESIVEILYTHYKLDNIVFHAYTDGGYQPKIMCGGWGYVIYRMNESNTIYLQDNAGKYRTTNQEMEITGMLKCLESIPNVPCLVVIHSDSKYVLNTIVKDAEGEIRDGRITGWYSGWKNKGWKTVTGPVAHLALWHTIIHRIQELNRSGARLQFKWIKGHSNNIGNDYADKLATQAIQECSQVYK